MFPSMRHGALSLVGRLARRIPRILMYHRFQEQSGGPWPDADLFDWHIRYLTRHYRIVSLRELRDAISRSRIPVDSVVLTIDDGYGDFYKLAYPILRKHGVPATLYVTTDFVDGDVWFWWDKVAFILENTAQRQWRFQKGNRSRNYDLTDSRDRRAAWSAVGSYCMNLREPDRAALLEELGNDLGTPVPSEPPERFRPVTWAQVQEMAGDGLEIGSHTCSHMRLSLATSDELTREVVESKLKLEGTIDHQVESFCYPFGLPDDINESVRLAVKAAGYQTAVVAYADSKVTNDLFALRRFGIGPDLEHFFKIVSGAEAALARVRHLGRES